MSENKLVFHIFTASGCQRCKEELPGLLRMFAENSYKIIIYDLDDIDGLTEAAMRGVTETPHVIGEIEGGRD